MLEAPGPVPDPVLRRILPALDSRNKSERTSGIRGGRWRKGESRTKYFRSGKSIQPKFVWTMGDHGSVSHARDIDPRPQGLKTTAGRRPRSKRSLHAIPVQRKAERKMAFPPTGPRNSGIRFRAVCRTHEQCEK